MGKDKYDKSNQFNLEKNSSKTEKYPKDAKFMENVIKDAKKALTKNLKNKKK